MNQTQERKYDTVLDVVNHWIADRNPISQINSESVRALGLSRDEDFNYLYPQLTKDVYYSPYVHKTMSVGDNLYLALEVVYCMALTPSPTVWYTGVDLVLGDNEEDNFVFRFINLMRDNYGCVSAGGHTRRQVSHQRSAKKSNH